MTRTRAIIIFYVKFIKFISVSGRQQAALAWRAVAAEIRNCQNASQMHTFQCKLTAEGTAAIWARWGRGGTYTHAHMCVCTFATANMFRFNSSQVAQMGNQKKPHRKSEPKIWKKKNWNEIHGAHLISCARQQSRYVQWGARGREKERAGALNSRGYCDAPRILHGKVRAVIEKVCVPQVQGSFAFLMWPFV